jgi:hypothetical protein
MRNRTRVTAAGIALASVMLSNPVTASASGPLQSAGGQGCLNGNNRTFQCFEYFTGGTAPYTFSGSTSNSYATIQWMTSLGNGANEGVWVYGDCVYGGQTWVNINILDSSGQTLSLARSISCSSGPNEV